MTDQTKESVARKASNYERYYAAPFNQPGSYPLHQALPETHYRPMAAWMGRLILPKHEERPTLQGRVHFEVHHTDADHGHLVGQTVQLGWSNDPDVQRRVAAVTRDVALDEKAKASIAQGSIHPERLDGWKRVDPLESLAGAHPHDDVFVSLPEPVFVDEANGVTMLAIEREPVQISGRYYALVTFCGRAETDPEQVKVRHFDRTSGDFTGTEEIMRLPQVIPNNETVMPSTGAGIEKSPLNTDGWYVYGAQDDTGRFVIQAWMPRALARLQPETIVFGAKAAWQYNRHDAWRGAKEKKGTVSTALLSARENSDQAAALADWQEGDQALLLHVYGGIGGNKKEPTAILGLSWGHFAFGVATVVREPLAGELVFAIVYHQIYTHNTDGIIAGSNAWMRYMGDRQFGWAGTRPVCDILIKQDAYTVPFQFPRVKRSGLDATAWMLEVMAARYRIGDGTGGTYVTAANNCAQDASQSLYGAIYYVGRQLRESPDLENWRMENPEEAKRLDRLRQLGRALGKALTSFGKPRTDWYPQLESLASNLERNGFQNLWLALGSWRAMLPRMASDNVLRVALEHGASAWVLRTNQIGGYDPEIEPIAPFP